jgi:hypothetical protein
MNKGIFQNRWLLKLVFIIHPVLGKYCQGRQSLINIARYGFLFHPASVGAIPG